MVYIRLAAGTDFSLMFGQAYAFNRPLDNWNVTSSPAASSGDFTDEEGNDPTFGSMEFMRCVPVDRLLQCECNRARGYIASDEGVCVPSKTSRSGTAQVISLVTVVCLTSATL